MKGEKIFVKSASVLRGLAGCGVGMVLGAALLLNTIPAAWAQDALRLDDFDKTIKPNSTYGKWNSKKFSPVFGSGDTYFFQFVHKSADEHYLHMKSGKNNSFTVGIEDEFEVKDWPILEWEWKIDKLPARGDVRVKERDDQAGAMCFIVNPGLTGFQSLCYIYENDGPKDTPITSTKNEDARYLILRTGKEDGTGKWLKEKRNMLEDFKKVFGSEPKKKAVIGVQIDSDSVQDKSEAFYRNIFRKKS
ncbi:MAG: DUF3047 domain-containing protein [Deltaproteobacteria bacterium]|nr:DUF3047 domain-containing protein [Deltaproteobacteria bacterium]